MSRHPTVKWAQRSDKIYLTIEVPDAKDVKLELDTEAKLSFSATRDGVPHEFEIELFDKIDVKESKLNVGSRNIVYVAKKAEKKWWSRLLKQEGKPPAFLKVDWDKWIDEDDETEKSGTDSQIQSMEKKQKNKNSSKKRTSLFNKMMSKLSLQCLGKRHSR